MYTAQMTLMLEPSAQGSEIQGGVRQGSQPAEEPERWARRRHWEQGILAGPAARRPDSSAWRHPPQPEVGEGKSRALEAGGEIDNRQKSI